MQMSLVPFVFPYTFDVICVLWMLHWGIGNTHCMRVYRQSN